MSDDIDFSDTVPVTETEVILPPAPRLPRVYPACAWCRPQGVAFCMHAPAEMPELASCASQVTKQDAGKPDWTLIFGHIQNALLACVRVREFGNKKYRAIAEKAGVPFDPESWRTNAPERYIKSAARHLLAVIAGERINHEDGEVEHIAQAMIDLAFAYEVELARRNQ